MGRPRKLLDPEPSNGSVVDKGSEFFPTGALEIVNLPEIKAFSVIRHDGLWMAVTLTIKGNQVIKKEVLEGDQKEISIMKALHLMMSEARLT